MFKLIVPVCLSLAMFSPSFSLGQDCGCNGSYETGDCGCETGCVKTRKKLALIESCIDIKRLRRVCETDECGCSRKRLALVSEPVSFKRLGLVDVPVDPCQPNLLGRVRDKMSSLSLRNRFGGGDCCETCDDGCGQEHFGGHITGASCGTDGGFVGESYQGGIESAPLQNQYYETSPQIMAPHNEMVPRSTQPRDVMPRNVTPRSTTPRNNPSVIEAPIEIENHSG